MKTYVITVSRNFPKTHPAAGKPTHFVESILNGRKTTTIRNNEKRHWDKVARAVKEEKAIISMRYWVGKPYASKQKEFAKCTKLATKRVFITNDHNGFEMSIDGKYQDNIALDVVIVKEGFRKPDHFYDWFTQEEFSGIMLEFLEIEKV